MATLGIKRNLIWQLEHHISVWLRISLMAVRVPIVSYRTPGLRMAVPSDIVSSERGIT